MAIVDPRKRQQLRKFIEEISKYKGRHTELVSVYVPSGYDLSKIIGHLQQEQGTAENIKSSATKKNVISALEKMVQHLRLFKSTPPNGLVVFCGNVSEQEGEVDLRVWSMEPPVPLAIRIYRCDKEFVVEPLQEMLEIKEAYGLIVMDRREGDIAMLKGKRIFPLISTHSNVPGKYKTGGQSAHRFEQLRELAAKEFYKKIAEYAKEKFLGMQELKGILVGGPGPTKYEFVDYLATELRRKILAIKDLSYTGEFGLNELVERSQDVLAAEELAEERKVMMRFFDLLGKKPGQVSYGLENVETDLKNGVVELLLLSEKLDDKTIDRMSGLADEKGSKVMLISIDTREGAQLKEIGGIAAILRYEVHS